MTVRLMSDRELQRLEVLQDLDRRRLMPAAAGQLLGLERRQVFRLLKAVLPHNWGCKHQGVFSRLVSDRGGTRGLDCEGGENWRWR